MPFAEACRYSRRRCSGWSRRPTTCAKARRLPREAQAGFKGQLSVRSAAATRSTDGASPTRRGLALRGRGVAVSTTSSPTGCRPARSPRWRQPARRPTDVTVVRVPGAFEIPLAARARGRERPLRRGRLPRLPRSAARRRTSSTSRRRSRTASRPPRPTTGVPMAFGVLTTNSIEEALARAGERRRQQGAGSGGRGHRDGGGCSRELSTSARRRRASAHDAASTEPTGTARARRRSRFSISGRSAGSRARGGRTTGPAVMRRRRQMAEHADACRSGVDELRAFATALVAGHRRAARRDRPADRRHRRTLAASSGWRSSIG